MYLAAGAVCAAVGPVRRLRLPRLQAVRLTGYRIDRPGDCLVGSPARSQAPFASWEYPA